MGRKRAIGARRLGNPRELRSTHILLLLGWLGTGKKFITDSRFARAVKQSSVTIGISISNI